MKLVKLLFSLAIPAALVYATLEPDRTVSKIQQLLSRILAMNMDATATKNIIETVALVTTVVGCTAFVVVIAKGIGAWMQARLAAAAICIGLPIATTSALRLANPYWDVFDMVAYSGFVSVAAAFLARKYYRRAQESQLRKKYRIQPILVPVQPPANPDGRRRRK